MAKVMISIPDELLKQLDSEANRQGMTRSALLQAAARREIGLGPKDRDRIVSGLEAIASKWKGAGDAADMIRDDRMRDG